MLIIFWISFCEEFLDQLALAAMDAYWEAEYRSVVAEMDRRDGV